MLILIRPALSRDKAEIIKMHKQAQYENLSTNFIESFLRELTVQLIVVLSAVLFILVGIPLHFCLISIPIVATGILMAVMAGHFHKAHCHKKNLEHMSEKYQLDPKCGFWVAEAWEGSLNDRQVQFVNESDIAEMESQGLLPNRRKTLVGTVAVGIKEDKDMSEPPGTVGLLERLLVVADCRRMGVGQELVLRAWEQCGHHVQAVELSMQANNNLARRFFEKQEWVLQAVMETQIFGLVRGEKMVYRKQCKKSLDDTM